MRWLKDERPDGITTYSATIGDLDFFIWKVEDEAGHFWEVRCSDDFKYHLALSLAAAKRWAETRADI